MGRGKRKKTNPIFKLCVLFSAFYVVVCLVNSQVDINNKKAELENIQEKIVSQGVENKNLERIINSDEDDEYIEKLAREKLGFAYPDERIYIDISGN